MEPAGRNVLAWRTLGREYLYVNPWCAFRVDDVELPDGARIEYGVLESGGFAAVVPVTRGGDVVLVRQWRQPLDAFTLELPSGLVDPGETPAVTAKRELLEETGYEAGEIELLGAMDPDLGRLGNQSWGCFARGVRRVECRVPEAGIEVLEWTLEELYRAIALGQFAHALHVAIVFQAVLRGRIAGPEPCAT